ncbi:MAG: TonB-dependent receptor [Rudaea sp.]|uniref:TonB-dependent receptor n=1 Tax=unclassified Rudaea TaxID=2627037 RepID=UPI0010F61BCC|nr:MULTISPECIES: TonB-dependent receptor [unclassified Rudaea]MBN8885597.1 TonB-dependent receptor [Rudaea sp.]
MLKTNSSRASARGQRVCVLSAAVFCALVAMQAGAAETAAAPADAADVAAASADGANQLDSVVVSAKNSTRSAVSLSGAEIQKIQPGASPLKAIQTLPGVLYQTADPWGNNEQNTLLFIHGFSTQQLGYTLDGVPLGDQQYGNYNGLSPQRAVISENVSAVTLASGAGDLSTASTSNLGGTVATFSSDPLKKMGGQINQTFGSNATTRTFLRYDTGEFAGGNSAYASIMHQDQRAWDFAGHQRGWQANGKFVHDDENGKLTVYVAYSDKIEPNEDSIYRSATGAGEGTPRPYNRPFMYPDFQRALAYLGANGAPPASAGNNYLNYYSDAQRTDYLSYAKYEWRLNDAMTWTNQVYYHHDDGVGVVAGPIQVAGLPKLFGAYFPGQDLKTVFGGSGYATRTTEYDINRRGWLTSFDWQFGDHQIDAGLWYEMNRSSTNRRWYALDVNHPTSPYERPGDTLKPLITQYNSEIKNEVVQPYLQDQWKLSDNIRLQAGFKASYQFAHGWAPISPLPNSTAGFLELPSGRIYTRQKFLPQIGALWEVTPEDQLFVNVQKNMRQFITYGAGGLSPWSLGSQDLFNTFKQNIAPETAWAYEGGWRFQHELEFGPISGIDGQVSAYHVDFSNRLLAVGASAGFTTINPGAVIINNVGSVTTDGIDLSATFHFGEHFSFYDALSYNRSKYDDDYVGGFTKDPVTGQNVPSIVHTSGKSVPASPNWLNKFVFSTNFGGFSAQLSGDYVGKRYATYTNDLSVPSYFLLGLQASYALPNDWNWVHDAKVSLNVSNLADRKGVYEVIVGAPSATYNTYPIPPRQFFVTFSAKL